MLEFWCLSPVRVAYHGSFRKNLESAFWGFGVSYLSSDASLQRALKCCSFDASPQSECDGSFRENLESAFWALECHIAAWLGRCKSSKKAPLEYCSFADASPQSEWFITAFRENLESSFRGLGLSYVISLMKQGLQNGAFEMLQFWCLSPVRVAYHGSFRENLGSAVDCHITTWLGRCKSSKRAPLKCCSFDASPQSEWLITAHLERIWSQHFGALECHIAAWLGRCKSSKKAPLDAFLMPLPSEWFITAHLERICFQGPLMPLPSQSGLSRLI